MNRRTALQVISAPLAAAAVGSCATPPVAKAHVAESPLESVGIGTADSYHAIVFEACELVVGGISIRLAIRRVSLSHLHPGMIIKKVTGGRAFVVRQVSPILEIEPLSAQNADQLGLGGFEAWLIDRMPIRD